MRAYVMARKGILISDPSVARMNRTQWLFEYLALTRRDREDKEFNVRAMKSVIISTFGLNLIRPEDGNGNPKTIDQMTDEEREQYIPLTAWIGNEGMLKAVQQQHEKIDIPVDMPISDKSYEDMVAAIDAAGGDIEPIIGIDQMDIPSDAKKRHDEKVVGILDRSKIDVGEV